jgi:hypothetical protein
MQHRHFCFRIESERNTRKKLHKTPPSKTPLLLWKKEKTGGKKTALLSTSRGRTFFLSLHQERSNAKTSRSSYLIPYYSQTKSTLTPIARGRRKESKANNKN